MAPPDFSSEKWAGAQTPISPPSTSTSRACPERTVTSLPLASTVVVRPFSTSTLTAPFTAMSSPSMRPTVAGGACDRIVPGVKKSTASKLQRPRGRRKVQARATLRGFRDWIVDCPLLVIADLNALRLYYTLMSRAAKSAEAPDEQPRSVHYNARPR